MYMHVCVCAACVRAACVRSWPWPGKMGIRIRRKWISAPDAHPKPEMHGGPEPRNDAGHGGPGLRAEMMVGMPTIISAPDLHPERKFHREDGGMQSFCA